MHKRALHLKCNMSCTIFIFNFFLLCAMIITAMTLTWTTFIVIYIAVFSAITLVIIKIVITIRFITKLTRCGHSLACTITRTRICLTQSQLQMSSYLLDVPFRRWYTVIRYCGLYRVKLWQGIFLQFNTIWCTWEWLLATLNITAVLCFALTLLFIMILH